MGISHRGWCESPFPVNPRALSGTRVETGEEGRVGGWGDGYSTETTVLHALQYEVSSQA